MASRLRVTPEVLLPMVEGKQEIPARFDDDVYDSMDTWTWPMTEGELRAGGLGSPHVPGGRAFGSQN
jgi:hypothetical protein